MITYTTNKLGDVTLNGTTIHLTQQAFADSAGTDGGVAYFAHGVDDEGNEYQVRWETTAAWNALQASYRNDPDNTDCDSIPEDEACDWDEYVVRAL
jgi:hypothetical protein